MTQSEDMYSWDHCDHSKGIGKIGCVTCDPIDKHVRNRLRWLEDNGRISPKVAPLDPTAHEVPGPYSKSRRHIETFQSKDHEPATVTRGEWRKLWALAEAGAKAAGPPPSAREVALRDNLQATQDRCNALLTEKRNGPGAICVRRLRTAAKLPERAHDGDSGLDLCACIDASTTIPAGGRATIPTGIAFAVPKGFEAQVRPRSGLARDHGIMAVFGTCDSPYRGEIGVTLLNTGREAFTVRPGDRIAQVVFQAVVLCDLVEVDELDETARGDAGFGSTGR